MTDPAPEAGALTERADTTAVVNGLDARPERGSAPALLGPNGSGKTTTVRRPATRLRPTGDSARVCGAALRTAADQRARTRSAREDRSRSAGALPISRPVRAFERERRR